MSTLPVALTHVEPKNFIVRETQYHVVNSTMKSYLSSFDPYSIPKEFSIGEGKAREIFKSVGSGQLFGVALVVPGEAPRLVSMTVEVCNRVGSNVLSVKKLITGDITEVAEDERAYLAVSSAKNKPVVSMAFKKGEFMWNFCPIKMETHPELKNAACVEIPSCDLSPPAGRVAPSQFAVNVYEQFGPDASVFNCEFLATPGAAIIAPQEVAAPERNGIAVTTPSIANATNGSDHPQRALLSRAVTASVNAAPRDPRKRLHFKTPVSAPTGTRHMFPAGFKIMSLLSCYCSPTTYERIPGISTATKSADIKEDQDQEGPSKKHKGCF